MAQLKTLPPPRLDTRLFRWVLVLLVILISAYTAREMTQRSEVEVERRASFLRACESQLTAAICLDKWEANRGRCHRAVSDDGAVFLPREFDTEAFQRCVLLGFKAWRTESANAANARQP